MWDSFNLINQRQMAEIDRMKYAHQGTPDLTWETLSDVARYSLERCIDRVREGQRGLVNETFDNGDCYAYLVVDKINIGINGGPFGFNIFRDQIPLDPGDERTSPMPKKSLKLKDWQEAVRTGNPEMFDPKPMELTERKSPLIKVKTELTHEEKVGIVKRAFGWFK